MNAEEQRTLLPLSNDTNSQASISSATSCTPSLSSALRPLQNSLDKLFVEVMELEPPYPHEKADLCTSDTGLLVDHLAVRVARSRGALGLAIGARLDALLVGERLLSLGYAKVVDYAHEELGIGGRSALQMAQLSRELRTRPLLRQSLFCGAVSARKALVVLPVATGEYEASWTLLAKHHTVRHLEEAVQHEKKRRAQNALPGKDGVLSPHDEGRIQGEGRAQGEGDAQGEALFDNEDQAFCHVELFVPKEEQHKVDEAFALAKRILGPKATKAQCLEVICQEYLASYPPPDEAEFHIQAQSDEAKLASLHMRELQKELEELTEHWSFLDCVENVDAPMGELPSSALLLHEELLQLAAMRCCSDELLGRLALLLQMLGLWRHMEFASFGHYCTERLGLSGRTLSQRASLERSFWDLPQLHSALRSGAIHYEQARLIARFADEDNVEERISRAQELTFIELKQELEGEAQEQMCAQQLFALRVPASIETVFSLALSAAQEHMWSTKKRWPCPHEAFLRIVEHFLETWQGRVPAAPKKRREILERHGGLCSVPACSGAALHLHHITYRSQGGSNDSSNLTALCMSHHLRGIHHGHIRVHGTAPHELSWEIIATGKVLRSGVTPVEIRRGQNV